MKEKKEKEERTSPPSEILPSPHSSTSSCFYFFKDLISRTEVDVAILEYLRGSFIFFILSVLDKPYELDQ